MKRIILITFFIWLALIFAGYKVIHTVETSSNDDFQWTERGIPVEGTVVSKERDNHGAVNYVYSVDGKEFTGAGSGGSGNPGFDEIEIGQRVIVVYDPGDPGRSRMGYFYPARDNWLVYLGAVILGTVPTTMFFIMFMGIRHVIRERRKDEERFPLKP